ncbi:MAG: hypothetical protein HQM10_14195 [Candidatus Riflebacteria bacterium]|nr:hypothetical protein [Candidatus Riflebacteria bacterium]
MFKRLSTLLVVLFFLGLVAGASAQDKVLLQYSPKPGTTTKYKMNLQGTTVVTAMQRAQKTELKTDMGIEQKITGVDPKGNIEMATTITDGSITVNGTPTPLPAVGQVIKVKMAKNGEVISSEGMDSQTNFQNMQIKFPEKPTGIGESWEATISPNPQLPIPLKVKYTLLGFETVDGFDCAKLESVVTTDKGGAAGSINLNVKANGKIWFAHKDGIMVKNEVISTMNMVMENDMGGGKKEKIETRMNLKLIMGIAK